MSELNVKSIVEAAIFASDDPITVERLRSLFDEQGRPDKECVQAVLEELVQDYEDRGVQLQKVASGYRFQAKSDFATWLQRLWERKPPRYSRAVLETLALIAYKQPITRGEIESVRGVAVSSNIVKTLLDRKWVKIIGYREVPGRPALLATTKDFLDYFNLSGLSDLPALADIKDLDTVGQQIDLELSGTVAVDQSHFVGPMLPASSENTTSNNEASSDIDLAAIAEQVMSESPDNEERLAQQTDASDNVMGEESSPIEIGDAVIEDDSLSSSNERLDNAAEDGVEPVSLDASANNVSDTVALSEGEPQSVLLDKDEMTTSSCVGEASDDRVSESAGESNEKTLEYHNETTVDLNSERLSDSEAVVSKAATPKATADSIDEVEQLSQNDFKTLVDEMQAASSVAQEQDTAAQEQHEEAVTA